MVPMACYHGLAEAVVEDADGVLLPIEHLRVSIPSQGAQEVLTAHGVFPSRSVCNTFAPCSTRIVHISSSPKTFTGHGGTMSE